MFDVEKYANFALQQRANGFKMFAENQNLIAGIPVGGRVLDIGCGPGTVTQFLTNFTNLGEIFGTDFDPRMIEEAKKRNSSSRLFFQVWDVQKPPNVSQKFHLVTANAMMHWIPDQKAALENIYNCLKPGGFFLAHFMARSHPFSSQHRIQDEEKWKPYIDEVDQARFSIRRDRKQPWMSEENPADFYRLMFEDQFQEKFKILTCELRPMNNFYNETELQAHCEMQAGNSLKVDVPEEKRKEFVNEIKNAIKKKWDCVETETGNFYIHKNERIVLLAQKISN